MPQLLHEDYSVCIISIVRSSVSVEALKQLNKHMVYQDLDPDLAEHLYSVEDIDEAELHPDLQQIKEFCRQKSAGYFRLVIM